MFFRLYLFLELHFEMLNSIVPNIKLCNLLFITNVDKLGIISNLDFKNQLIILNVIEKLARETKME